MSTINPLLSIQDQTPYYLLSDRENPFLKEHPNYEKFILIEDEEKNSEYFGEIDENGKKHGFGLERYEDGNFYIGEYEEGDIRGKGVMYFGKGDAVRGVFGRFGKLGLEGLSGKGIYRWMGGKKFSGELEKGIPNGKGESFNFFLTKFF